MRVWDVDPKILCRKHLLAEHRELHGLWNILTKHSGQGGYSRHPETLRWVDKTLALYRRHELLVAEFVRRGYNHATPLDEKLASGSGDQTDFIDSPARQLELLAAKPCDCPISATQPYHLYIMRCADGTLYSGITTDIERRLAEHNGQGGKGAKYTAARRPVELAYEQIFASRSLALKAEAKVKRLSRQDKLELIKNKHAL
jgi:predicted GIY-YIG superfamily endonuclease